MTNTIVNYTERIAMMVLLMALLIGALAGTMLFMFSGHYLTASAFLGLAFVGLGFWLTGMERLNKRMEDEDQ